MPIAVLHIEADGYDLWLDFLTASSALEAYDRVRKRPAYIEWLDTTNHRTQPQPTGLRVEHLR